MSPGRWGWTHSPVRWSGSPRRCAVPPVGQCTWWEASCSGWAQTRCTPDTSWWCWDSRHSRSPPPTKKCICVCVSKRERVWIRGEEQGRGEPKMINGFTKTWHKLNFLCASLPFCFSLSFPASSLYSLTHSLFSLLTLFFFWAGTSIHHN